MAKTHFPGLQCCIVKHGRIVFASGYGWANIEDRVPMTPDSIQEIASISKTVVATATMQGVERGVLTLDEDIGSALGWSARNPSYPNVPITVEMLLTHTSSITDFWPAHEKLYSWGGDSTLPLDDVIYDLLTPGGPYCNPQKTWGDYEPGAQYSYSNTGAATCGDVVERATGVPFDTWCNENIFEPLGMTNTSYRLRDLPAGMLAMPYVWRGGRYVPLGQYSHAEYPCVSLHTSVTQLGKFLIAYLQGGVYRGHRILQAATVDEILSSQVPDLGLDWTQGLIWFTWSFAGRTTWGHSGYDDGVTTDMYMDRTRGEGVITFANGELTGQADYEALYDGIIPRLFEKADAM
jgi:CubicO group peptidase (beta-lactamase class C family)